MIVDYLNYLNCRQETRLWFGILAPENPFQLMPETLLLLLDVMQDSLGEKSVGQQVKFEETLGNITLDIT